MLMQESSSRTRVYGALVETEKKEKKEKRKKRRMITPRFSSISIDYGVSSSTASASIKRWTISNSQNRVNFADGCLNQEMKAL